MTDWIEGRINNIQYIFLCCSLIISVCLSLIYALFRFSSDTCSYQRRGGGASFFLSNRRKIAPEVESSLASWTPSWTVSHGNIVLLTIESKDKLRKAEIQFKESDPTKWKIGNWGHEAIDKSVKQSNLNVDGIESLFNLQNGRILWNPKIKFVSQTKSWPEEGKPGCTILYCKDLRSDDNMGFFGIMGMTLIDCRTSENSLKWKTFMCGAATTFVNSLKPENLPENEEIVA